MGGFSVVAAAVQSAWNDWWKALLGAALVIAPAFLLGQCSVDVDQVCSGREAKASSAALRTDRSADSKADVARRTDDQAIPTQSQAVKDATHALPDQTPTARQHARACSLLRQRGAAADVLGSAGC